MSATSSLATRKHAASASVTMLEMCSVQVGQTLFGIPITHILEIAGGVQPRAVPLAPKFIGGLVHYRGDVLTTVSLRRLLGLPERGRDEDGDDEDSGGNCGSQNILVLESSGGCFGLLVDSIGEVLTVSPADYEPNPSILDEWRGALFAGAYKLQKGLLVMLDPERLDPVRLDSMLLDLAQPGSERSGTVGNIGLNCGSGTYAEDAICVS